MNTWIRSLSGADESTKARSIIGFKMACETFFLHKTPNVDIQVRLFIKSWAAEGARDIFRSLKCACKDVAYINRLAAEKAFPADALSKHGAPETRVLVWTRLGSHMTRELIWKIKASFLTHSSIAVFWVDSGSKLFHLIEFETLWAEATVASSVDAGCDGKA